MLVCKTIPDKDEQQTLINEAKIEKHRDIQERSKRIEDSLPAATKQVVKQTKMVGAFKPFRLAINNIDVKYAMEIYDYVILHLFREREILELLCNCRNTKF